MAAKGRMKMNIVGTKIVSALYWLESSIATKIPVSP